MLNRKGGDMMMRKRMKGKRKGYCKGGRENRDIGEAG